MKTQISHAKSTPENDNVRSVYAQLREEYLAFLEESRTGHPDDPEPVGRYKLRGTVANSRW
jgi:hypothetical protein